MSTTTLERTMTVATSKAHVIAVAARFDTIITIDGNRIYTRRHVEGLGELLYSAVLGSAELIA